VKRLECHQDNLKFLIKKTDCLKKYKLQNFFDEIDNEIKFLDAHPLYNVNVKIKMYSLWQDKNVQFLPAICN